MFDVMRVRGAVRFAEFELDPENHVLTRNGVVVKLAPQPFKVLLLLTGRPGTLVMRETLRQRVWGDETVVDCEHGLNTCIRHIRLALGDNADVPRFVETVPRLGYRFTAPVTTVAQRDWRARRLPAGAAVAGVIVVGVLIARGVVPRGTREAKTGASAVRELYLRGRLALEDPSAGSAHTALELFDKALAADPQYAPAQAGVAHVYLQKPSSVPGVSPDVAVRRAQYAVERSLTLDESL